MLVKAPRPQLADGSPYLASHTKGLYTLAPGSMQQLPGLTPAMCAPRSCWSKAQLLEWMAREEQAAAQAQQQATQQQQAAAATAAPGPEAGEESAAWGRFPGWPGGGA